MLKEGREGILRGRRNKKETPCLMSVLTFHYLFSGHEGGGFSTHESAQGHLFKRSVDESEDSDNEHGTDLFYMHACCSDLFFFIVCSFHNIFILDTTLYL